MVQLHEVSYILPCVGSMARDRDISTDWAKLSRLSPEDEDRVQSPKRRFNVQKVSNVVTEEHTACICRVGRGSKPSEPFESNGCSAFRLIGC
jgi:hypothetical protein